MFSLFVSLSLFFFNDTATTEIYTLSLHDALPICSLLLPATRLVARRDSQNYAEKIKSGLSPAPTSQDRKSTRLNSSHTVISYAVFCLKKKKKKHKQQNTNKKDKQKHKN